MKRVMLFVGGVCLGGALMYMLDPNSGSRRRAIAKDKARSAWHGSQEVAQRAARDVAHRATGVAVRGRSLLRGRAVPDEELAESVRSKLGRVVSHPKAIMVEARDGLVSLSGDVFADELRHAVQSLRKVRGVRAIRNDLRAHVSGEGVISLQGGRRRRRGRAALNVMAGVLGGLFATYWLLRYDPWVAASGVAGTGFLVRAAYSR